MQQNSLFRLNNVPPAVYGKVLERIHFEEERLARSRALLSLVLVVLSSALCVGAAIWLWNDLAHSEFIQSFSLFFSDRQIVMQYWQDFSSTLLEAVPFVSLASCLAALSAVIVSVYALVKYRTKYNRYHALYKHSGLIAG